MPCYDFYDYKMAILLLCFLSISGFFLDKKDLVILN